MVSIPRDSYVPIPGYGSDKINAAFAFGGAPLLVQTVEEATGLRIDHYAEIGFSGFAGIVDAVGGVNVCLAQPIDDPLAGINLPAGCQDLKGSGCTRVRANSRDGARRPRPHEQPAPVHVGVAVEGDESDHVPSIRSGCGHSSPIPPSLYRSTKAITSGIWPHSPGRFAAG